MRIRHADPEPDGAACAAIYAPSVTDHWASFEERAPSADEMASRIERYSSSHAWLMAENSDGTPLGFAYGCPYRERAAYRWSAEVSVYVDAAHHRRGVGRRLYRELFELLSRQGLHVLLAGITLPNDGSVALHESCGFRPVGIYREIGFKAGAWRDVGWWQLELRPGGETPPAELRAPQHL